MKRYVVVRPIVAYNPETGHPDTTPIGTIFREDQLLNYQALLKCRLIETVEGHR
jgi:hypothetical protein